MSEEVTVRKERAKRVDVKIYSTSYAKLSIYADAVHSSPSKIINDLIKEYLETEEVKTVLKENVELVKLKEVLLRKKAELAELDKKIKEIENLHK